MAFFLCPSAIMRLGRSGCSAKVRSLCKTSHAYGRVVPFKLSDIGEGIREVTVKEWFVQPGDKVAQFDNVCEVQSDKASVTITSRYDGLVKALHYKVDDVALVGNPLVDIEIDQDTGSSGSETDGSSSEEESENRILQDVPENEHGIAELYEKALATPAVRKIAMENNIKLKDVAATGKNNRVLKEDVLNYIQKMKHSAEQKTVETETGSRIPLKGYTKHMWKTMTKSLSIPHFVYSDECDVTKLVKFRGEVKVTLGKQGLSLTYMPFFIKAVSKALEEIPQLNARLDEDTQTIVVLPEHNISIAMDTPEGLVVPNIKNVQNLSIIGVAKELNRLQELGKNTAIPPRDLAGGTISLSNIGVVGGTYTKPVILPPQIVIGAIGRTQRVPRFDDEDNVVPANILSVSWAADHRVVDGVTMAKFSNIWKYYVENPSILVLGL